MLGSGARVGTLEVIGPLGAGGMGEVWRARDGRLGRDVAIKTVPDDFASDQERLARFEREARLLAALKHPGIAAIYGLEQSESGLVLVLELVEGQTLGERLRRGALPVREALDIARQIAEGLKAAHEKGIVHRDLKPSNIKITPEGRVKLLDFGLAKAISSEASTGDRSTLSTDTSPSEVGVPLGTAPYMSPEQARGEVADRRTDVWAFGCVLYEMLAGRRAFAGTTHAELIARVLEREPDWSLVPEATPALARSLLRRCLQKDKARRLQDIGDAWIEIDEALHPQAALAPGGRARWRFRAAAAGGLVLAVGIAASWLWTARAPARQEAPVRFNIDIPPHLALPLATNRAGGTGSIVAISPDGAAIVFQAAGKGLYLRRLDSTESVPIRGTEAGTHPFFSPDGKWIGFQANGKLQKVPVGGGPARILADAPSLRGASWADDGTITYTPSALDGLSRISAEGGAPQALTKPDPAVEMSHRWPQVLPGGAVLFTSHPGTGRAADARIAARSPAGAWKVLVQGGMYGRYVPTGHLLYANGGTVFAAPFDVERLELAGPAVPVLQDVRMSVVAGPAVAYLDFSRTGVLVYVGPYPRPRRAALLRVGPDGSATPISDPRMGLRAPSLSPDGGRLVACVTEPDGSFNLWRYELENRSWTQLTFGHDNCPPLWSPRGDRIAFSSSRPGEFHLFVMSADGGAPQPLSGTPSGWSFPSSWSPDGQTLFFHNPNPETGMDLWELPLGEKAQARPLLVAPRHQQNAQLSPDGRWLAYEEQDLTGQPRIHVRPYRGADRTWTIAGDGGDSGLGTCCPRWSRTGRELFYLGGRAASHNLGGSSVMAVSMSPAGSTMRVGLPRLLFDRGREILGYDLTPDGQAFVIAEDVDEPEHLRVVIVPRWFDELRAKVPGGRGMR